MFRTVETHVHRAKTVWVLGSSLEGIRKPSIFTNSKFLSFVFLLFKIFHAVDRCKLLVCLLSSQRPRAALSF